MSGKIESPHIGHNAKNDVGERLLSIVQRYERLNEEKVALASDQRDILKEAASAGFDKKVLRQLIRIRKQKPGDVEEQEALLDIYRRAIGMA